VTKDKNSLSGTVPGETSPLVTLTGSASDEILQSRERAIWRLRLTWDSRGLLRRVLWWSFIASTILALLISNRYQATVRLMPPEGQSGSALAMLGALASKAGGAGVAGFAGDLLGVKSSGALFVGILGSQTVQDRLIQEFDLRRIYGALNIEDAREDLMKHAAISEDRKSGIITIQVTDRDPKRAAALATAYVQELDRLVAKVSTSAARRERIFLEDRLKSVKLDLDAASRSFSDFASKNTAIDIPAQGRAMVEAAARLQGELIAAESTLRGLEAIYTDQNVRVRATRAKVAELRAQLDKLGGESGSASDPSKEANALYPSIRRLPILGVTYFDLYRQARIQETVYDLLTQQYELAKVEEAKEIPSVKVLDAAVVPTKKVFPPRIAVSLLGTMFGVMLAVTWIVLRAQWESVDTADPRKALAIEVFATVHGHLPRFSSNGFGSEANGHRTWALWKKTGDAPPQKQDAGDIETK
jgi:capsule polysaccharide export protein KpsE/RkpR